MHLAHFVESAPLTPCRLGITAVATLGGFLFGYDQGVVGNVLVLENFGAHFPRVYSDAGIKVCSLLLFSL